MVECGGLEIRCTARYRGFESLSLRNKGCKSASYAIYTLYYTRKYEIGCFLFGYIPSLSEPHSSQPFPIHYLQMLKDFIKPTRLFQLISNLSCFMKYVFIERKHLI